MQGNIVSALFLRNSSDNAAELLDALSSRWKRFADVGSSPIGGDEQSAIAAELSAFTRRTISRRFSQNHSGKGSR
jgi:hypothetical protein